jgi:transcriptional regulator with XRE-family HTH domain
MTGDDGIERPIDQFVREGWLAIGLSQADLAEVLGLDQAAQGGKGANNAGRLMLIAEALNVPVHPPSLQNGETGPDPSSPESVQSLQSLLALRLLRAFHEMSDQRAKEVLVHLAEQIVKRQTGRGGDAG